MIDVCGNDGATARDLGADEFGSDRIANCRLPIADWFGAGMAEVQIVALAAVRRGAERCGRGARAPQNFATEIFSNRDELHFWRDDSLSRVR